MSYIYSSDKAMAGIWRAFVVDISEDTAVSVYIPALHREQMPFKDASNPKAGLLEEVEGNKAGTKMRKCDYPKAQMCAWQMRTQLSVGDAVWVMFENGDANYPVIMGQLGATLPLGNIGGGYSDPDYADTFEKLGTYVGGGTTGNKNGDYIFNELISHGASIAGACGVLANVSAESSFSTALNNGDSGLASGLCQWHPDRWNNLVLKVKENNSKPLDSIERQTSFLIWEISKGYADLWQKICTAEDGQGAYNVGYQMCFDFERPANKAVKSDERGNSARNTYWPIFMYGKIENKKFVNGSDGVIDAAVQWAIKIAEDSTHGYDQSNRKGPDYDCSSFVCAAYRQAGIKVDFLTTHTMYDKFLELGFQDVTDMVDLKTGRGTQPGDIMLEPSSHTEMIASPDGRIVGAHGNKDGKPGESKNNEIYVCNYHNNWGKGWKYALRYKGANT